MTSEDINNLVDKLTDKDCQEIIDIVENIVSSYAYHIASEGHAFREALKVRLMRLIIEGRQSVD